MKYKRKPSYIDAFRFRVDPVPTWFMAKVSSNSIITYDDCCDIINGKSITRAVIGDYIIKGTKGEIYFLRPDTFNKNFEPCNE